MLIIAAHFKTEGWSGVKNFLAYFCLSIATVYAFSLLLLIGGVVCITCISCLGMRCVLKSLYTTQNTLRAYTKMGDRSENSPF